MSNVTFKKVSDTSSASGCGRYKIVKITDVNAKYVCHELRVSNGDMVMQGRAGACREAANAHANGVLGAATTTATTAPTNHEDAQSDEQLLGDINKRFSCMQRFVQFGIEGRFTSVLITGPGGIGKTYPVERMLEEARGGGRVVHMVSGSITPVKLIEMLWETKNRGDVLLLDDADLILKNMEGLNILKAATDSKGVRVVSYLKQNRQLQEAGIENQFEYKGTVIIISNANMAAAAEKSGHIDAILSRAMHIDLGINSKRALALRVADMITNKRMFDQKFAMAGMSDLAEQGAEEIAAFIVNNRDAFRSLTLREADKVCRMYLACEGGSEWAEMALLSLGQL